jgi:preprotein translocase SecF subunit
MVPDAEIRRALNEAGVRTDPIIQYQRGLGEGKHSRLVVQVGPGDGPLVERVLSERFTHAGLRLVQKEDIGSHIGHELKRRGAIALAWSLVGMLIYISIRFEFAFAVGAIVALFHDAWLSVGLFCLLGHQLTAPMIAVVLTIIGYSVNDTIVVFDRIREGVKLWKGRPYREICHLAINQTLSRTLLTSGTTLLSVLALWLLGGGAINDFAFLLLIGIIVGTYSSVFIATPVMLFWHRDDRAVPVVAAPARAKK